MYFFQLSNSSRDIGQLLRHKHSSKSYLTIDNTHLLFYIDDTAWIYKSRDNLTMGLNFSYNILRELGLEMHIGHNDTSSKSERIFFLPPRFFKFSMLPPSTSSNSN